jgi:hypothetical protein
MSTLIDYRGLQVVNPNPSGLGGRAINDNFKKLTTFITDVAPGTSDDSTAGFVVGSRWFAYAPGGESLEFICVGATPGAAEWSQTTVVTAGSIGLGTDFAVEFASVTALSPSVFGQLDAQSLKVHKATVGGVVTLTASGTTVATDASQGNTFKITLANSYTISNPTNPTDGQIITYRLKQDSTGSRTVSWGSAFRFSGGVQPALTVAGGKVDYIGFRYDSADAKWDNVAERLNF